MFVVVIFEFMCDNLWDTIALREKVMTVFNPWEV